MREPHQPAAKYIRCPRLCGGRVYDYLAQHHNNVHAIAYAPTVQKQPIQTRRHRVGRYQTRPQLIKSIFTVAKIGTEA